MVPARSPKVIAPVDDQPLDLVKTGRWRASGVSRR